MMHFVQLHYVGVRLAQPQGGHFALRIRLQPGGGGGGSGQPPSGPALPESPPPGPAPPGSAHPRLRILTANSWPLWRCRQRRHTEKLPWPSAGSRRSSSYCWKKGESWGRRGARQRSYPGASRPCHAPSQRGSHSGRLVKSGLESLNPDAPKPTYPHPGPTHLHHGAPGHRCPAGPVSSTSRLQYICHHRVVVVKQDGGRHEGVSLAGKGGCQGWMGIRELRCKWSPQRSRPGGRRMGAKEGHRTGG